MQVAEHLGIARAAVVAFGPRSMKLALSLHIPKLLQAGKLLNMFPLGQVKNYWYCELFEHTLTDENIKYTEIGNLE